MKKNVGSVERIIRIIAGAAILSLAFVGLSLPGHISASCRWQRASWAGARLCAAGHFHLRQGWQLRYHHRGVVVLRE